MTDWVPIPCAAVYSQRDLPPFGCHPAFHVTVVSGRSLGDLRARVDLPGIVYVGNHGLEVFGPGIGHTQAISELTMAHIRVLAGELSHALSGYSDVIVEDK